jgi:dephospho-CoA kinase
MQVWAITGGIACGKTTVANLLRQRGCPVASADEDARMVVREPDVAAQIARLFPECFETGELDRRRLADRVFADPDARAQLNSVMHPAIRRHMKGRIDAWRTSDAPALAFYEVPLLFEGDLQGWFDGVVAVIARREVQIERLRRRERESGRPDLDDAAVAVRLASQLDPREKARRADFVVDTSASMDEVSGQLDQFLARTASTRAPEKQ